MIYDNVLDAMGNTPIIRLRRMVDEDMADVLVKFEGVNIGGSVKTRPAYAMIATAERFGGLKPGKVVVEPTSGNQGIGLALICAVKGYRCIIIMPDSVSEERYKLCRHYGAEVMLIHDEGDIGECIDRCTATAERMAEEDPNVFLPQQFVNYNNVRAHYSMTGEEIVSQVSRSIDGFCAGVGTGGTLSGVGKVLRAENPDIEIWAVEPENAAILSGGEVGSHIQMGIGDGLIPSILDEDVYDDVAVVTDEEALKTAKDLARLEGIACGISSGSNVAAALRLARKLGPGKTVVTICPDTAERYYSTPLFDE